jgi:hypothetical protein
MSVARTPHKRSFFTLIYGQILGVLTVRRKAGNSDIECIRAYIRGSEHLFEAFYPVCLARHVLWDGSYDQPVNDSKPVSMWVLSAAFALCF